jgi:hypothetical protein
MKTRTRHFQDDLIGWVPSQDVLDKMGMTAEDFLEITTPDDRYPIADSVEGFQEGAEYDDTEYGSDFDCMYY